VKHSTMWGQNPLLDAAIGESITVIPPPEEPQKPKQSPQMSIKPDLSIIQDEHKKQPLSNQDEIRRILTKKISMRHDSLSGFPQPAFIV